MGYTIIIFLCFTNREEAAVGERIVLWIRTPPQVPGSRPGWYGKPTFYRASNWQPPYQNQLSVC